MQKQPDPERGKHARELGGKIMLLAIAPLAAGILAFFAAGGVAAFSDLARLLASPDTAAPVDWSRAHDGLVWTIPFAVAAALLVAAAWAVEIRARHDINAWAQQLAAERNAAEPDLIESAAADATTGEQA